MPDSKSTGLFATNVDELVTVDGLVVEMIGCRIENDLQPFGLVLSVLDNESSQAEELIFHRVDDQYQDSPWTGLIHLRQNQVLRAAFIGVKSGTVCAMKIG